MSTGDRRAVRAGIGLALGAAIGLAACARAVEEGAPEEPPDRAPVVPFATDGLDPILPLPREAPDLDPDLVALGRELFVDPILSGAPLAAGQTAEDRDPEAHGDVTCASCHVLALAGTSGTVRSSAPGRPEGGINVPTTFNLAYVFRFSWSGRFESLDSMLTVALTSPAAMATTWEACVRRLEASREHRERFRDVLGGPVTEEGLRAALRAYVLSMTTPGARFDRYLRGEVELEEDELEGYALFRSFGCVSCHQGVNVGGNMHQLFGVMGDYFADRGTATTSADDGLVTGTGAPEDRHVFRVPSLRNVALTAPYFHDGSAATLEDAVATMARYQLGRPIEPDEIARIVAFLRTLTGEIADRTAE